MILPAEGKSSLVLMGITGGEGDFPGGSVVKNLPVSAGDVRDSGSILGSGRFPEKKMAISSSILTWEIPWTEEPGALQSMAS